MMPSISTWTIRFHLSNTEANTDLLTSMAIPSPHFIYDSCDGFVYFNDGLEDEHGVEATARGFQGEGRENFAIYVLLRIQVCNKKDLCKNFVVES